MSAIAGLAPNIQKIAEASILGGGEKVTQTGLHHFLDSLIRGMNQCQVGFDDATKSTDTLCRHLVEAKLMTQEQADEANEVVGSAVKMLEHGVSADKIPELLKNSIQAAKTVVDSLKSLDPKEQFTNSENFSTTQQNQIFAHALKRASQASESISNPDERNAKFSQILKQELQRNSEKLSVSFLNEKQELLEQHIERKTDLQKLEGATIDKGFIQIDEKIQPSKTEKVSKALEAFATNADKDRANEDLKSAIGKMSPQEQAYMKSLLSEKSALSSFDLKSLLEHIPAGLLSFAAAHLFNSSFAGILLFGASFIGAGEQASARETKTPPPPLKKTA